MRIAERYELEVLIGRGGMGEVWRACDQVLGRPVAVKVLTDCEDDAAAERFRREAQAAAVVNNQHVVDVHDFGWSDDGCYLVMELVDGRTLAAELRRRGLLSPGEATWLTAQAADGLAAAHREGVVHRDVKPGNLLLDGDGTVKVADFGIARFLDRRADLPIAEGNILGTSYYLAPERARAEPGGPPSDVYSLGCVLYQLLTGEPPFVGADPTDVLRGHLRDQPSGLNRLHGCCREYLPRLLAKDPEDRPSAAEVADWCRETSEQVESRSVSYLPVMAPFAAALAADTVLTAVP